MKNNKVSKTGNIAGIVVIICMLSVIMALIVKAILFMFGIR